MERYSGFLVPKRTYFGANGIQYPPVPKEGWYVPMFHLVPTRVNTSVMLISGYASVNWFARAISTCLYAFSILLTRAACLWSVALNRVSHTILKTSTIKFVVSGVVPPTTLGSTFNDFSGETNQSLRGATPNKMSFPTVNPSFSNRGMTKSSTLLGVIVLSTIIKGGFSQSKSLYTHNFLTTSINISS